MSFSSQSIFSTLAACVFGFIGGAFGSGNLPFKDQVKEVMLEEVKTKKLLIVNANGESVGYFAGQGSHSGATFAVGGGALDDVPHPKFAVIASTFKGERGIEVSLSSEGSVGSKLSFGCKDRKSYMSSTGGKDSVVMKLPAFISKPLVTFRDGDKEYSWPNQSLEVNED